MNLDVERLGAWIDEQGLPGGPLVDVEELPGGTQNVLVRFTRAGRHYVFRRGPWHLRKTSNAAIRREFRVLSALSGTDVPHPGFIAGCDDESVLGAVFYLMEEVDGFNPTVRLPRLHAGDAVLRFHMGLSAVDALTRLASVEHEAIGLGDLGRPDGFLERQVPRWLAELESYEQLPGYPGAALPGVEKVASWLDHHRPAAFVPGLSHGDFHLGNLLFRWDGPAVAAIVDWEMCTVGDPLVDLGWLLATWPDDGNSRVNALGAAGGLPSLEDLTARYSERSERDLTAVSWYAVLACFKLGILVEGTHARARAGRAPMATGELLHRRALYLLERASRWM